MSSSSTFSNNTSSTPYHITNPTSTNTQKSFSTPSTLSSSFQNSTTNSSYANPAWMNDPIYAAYCAQYYANLESTVVPPLSTAPSSSSIPNPASSLVSPTTRLPEDLGVGTLPLHSTPSLSASNPFLPQPLSSSIASDIPDLSNVILKTESKRKHTSSHPQLPSTSLSTTSSSHTTPSSSSSHPSSSQKKSGLSHSSESTSETSLKRKRKEGGDEENSKKESSHGPQKPKRMIRSAAGQIWEDKSLEDWPESDFRLFVGDLGPDVTEQTLLNAFGKFPSLQKVTVIRDKKSGKSRGYGFVSFMNAESYTRAFQEFNNKYIGSRPVKLRKSNWADRNIENKTSKLKKR